MMVIEKTRGAKADLLDVWLFVALDSPEQAERLVDELEEAMKKLAEYPNMGKERAEFSRGLISFPVGNYVIFYRKRTQGIVVSRVLHSRRDVDAVFE